MFNEPQIDHLELPCRRLPRVFDGLTVLHLSDLHITRWTRRLDRWRDTLEGLMGAQGGVDIVAITGDLGHRSWNWTATLRSVQRLLEPLTPRLGTYFILGNHDSVKVGPALAATRDAAGGPRVLLRNQSAFLRAASARIDVQLPPENGDPPPLERHSTPHDAPQERVALIGVHQHRRIDTDIPLAMGPVSPEDFKLVLMHYPDLVYPAAAAGADICLAGHTHGGQICWPDGKPIFGQDTLSARQCTGVHQVNGTWMVVNRGIGAAGLRMRIFCPPQVLLLTLRSVKERVLAAPGGW